MADLTETGVSGWISRPFGYYARRERMARFMGGIETRQPRRKNWRGIAASILRMAGARHPGWDLDELPGYAL